MKQAGYPRQGYPGPPTNRRVPQRIHAVERRRDAEEEKPGGGQADHQKDHVVRHKITIVARRDEAVGRGSELGQRRGRAKDIDDSNKDEKANDDARIRVILRLRS